MLPRTVWRPIFYFVSFWGFECQDIPGISHALWKVLEVGVASPVVLSRLGVGCRAYLLVYVRKCRIHTIQSARVGFIHRLETNWRSVEAAKLDATWNALNRKRIAKVFPTVQPAGMSGHRTWNRWDGQWVQKLRRGSILWRQQGWRV